MIKEIVIATNNKHKCREIGDILSGISIKVRSLSDFKKIPEVIEDGATLQQNAVKKAVETAKKLKVWALADDSGLEVPYLNNEPGVFSARWAGPNCSYEDNNKKLLEKLRSVSEKYRKAVFRTVIALSNPKGKSWTVEGRLEGLITDKQKGKNGFGYDPVFYVKSLKRTLAEIDPEKKNKISHRAKALVKAKKLIKKLIKI